MTPLDYFFPPGEGERAAVEDERREDGAAATSPRGASQESTGASQGRPQEKGTVQAKHRLLKAIRLDFL